MDNLEYDLLLLVDRNITFCRLMEELLPQERIDVVSCQTLEEGNSLFRKENPDIIMLDRATLGKQFHDIGKALVNFQNTPTILLISDENSDESAMALELGAEDVILKPFSLAEGAARIHSILRRHRMPIKIKKLHCNIAGLKMDLVSYTATIDGKAMDLHPRGMEILFLLATNAGKVFRREDIGESIWGRELYNPRTVDQHISRIRAELGDRRNLIESIHLVGYRFAKPLEGDDAK